VSGEAISVVTEPVASVLDGGAAASPSGSATTVAKPHLTIRPTRGWAALNLREIWQFRDLAFTLGSRDLKLRYKQTALGAIWVVLQPLMGAGVFSFVFGKVAKLPSDGVPYFIFSFAGLLGWNAFNATLGKVSSSMLGNAHLISKVYFPRLLLPLSSIFSTLVDFGVALGLMLVLLATHHINPAWRIALMPVWLILLTALAFGVGLVATALMVSYRDVGYVLPVFTQLLMYASPVAYAVSAVPERLRGWYYLNPVSSLLEAFRWSVLGVGELRVGWLAYAAAMTAAVLALGTLMFKRMERRFADMI
jgi:lipopolysaccharide transport system permease protein